MKKSWLLLMSFDEHNGSTNEIKTLYHEKSKKRNDKDDDFVTRYE